MGFSLGGLILAILGSWAQVRKPDFIVMLFVLSALFSASAAITLQFLGGRPIQPVTFVLPFILLYILRMPNVMSQIKRAVISDRAVVSLILFSIIALMTSVFSPLFMQGETVVYNVDQGKFVLRPFEFGSSHIAQLIYLMGSVLCFLIVVGLSRFQTGMDWFAKALITLTAINAFFGSVDLVTFYMGYPEALMFIKNAGYAMVDQSMHGLRRISGVNAETSAFSSASIGMLAFNVALYLKGLYRRYTGILSAVTAILLVVTTSSTAYAGMFAVALGVVVIEWKRLSAFVVNKNVFYVAVAVVGVVMILLLVFYDQVTQVFNSAVTQKLDSESGLERMGWNYQAWKNTVDTNFIGVGLGGNRASSLFMVVLSNVGILGLLAFFLFLLFSFNGANATNEKNGDVIAAAAKMAAFTMLVPALVSATSFYLGMLFYIFLGLGCSTRGIRVLAEVR